MLFHGDAIVNRANKFTKITSNTFIIYNCVFIVWIAILQLYGLMRCVFASNITKSAMDTFILVDLGDMMIVDAEVFPMGDSVDRFANEII